MESLEADVDRVAAETEFSGVVRVDRGDQVELVKAYGLAHRALQVPNTVDTQFGTASAVKGMTALTVVSLIVDGSLELSTPARDAAGRRPAADRRRRDRRAPAGTPIGHRRLPRRGHRARPCRRTRCRCPVHQLATTEQYLAVLDGFPTKSPPGEQFSYCNGGFIVLALIAERASGVPFHDLVHDRVCEPAGMVDTAFLRSDELPGRAAMGYLEIDGVWRTNVFHLPVRGNGDGGIYTTVADVRGCGSPSSTAGSFRRVGRRDGRAAQRHLRRRAVRPRVLARRYGRSSAVGGLRRRRVVPQLAPSDCRLTHTVISNTMDGAWPMTRRLLRTVGERTAGLSDLRRR